MGVRRRTLKVRRKSWSRHGGCFTRGNDGRKLSVPWDCIAVECTSRSARWVTLPDWRYGVTGDKVEVVYNGVERNGDSRIMPRSGIGGDEKIVLFLGRITMQKGPEYFLMAAKKVLEEIDNVKFVMAGSGDMMNRTIEMAAEMGIGH